MQTPSLSTLVEVTRGNIVESVHLGALAVVDASGRLLASLGDPDYATYMRSSSKPLQALPLLEGGGAAAFDLSDAEVAVMCASHSGTDEHVSMVRGLQAKIGVTESDLLCGTHPIGHESTRQAMQARGEAPTPLRHNCSGKHTGFLAQAVLRDLPKGDYINPKHPVQERVIQTFAEMVEFPLDKIAIGVDGCSAPVFGVPLRQAALGFARLADPTGLPEEHPGHDGRAFHGSRSRAFRYPRHAVVRREAGIQGRGRGLPGHGDHAGGAWPREPCVGHYI
jgi:L-asparaginase II